jgi:hypothetical protein
MMTIVAAGGTVLIFVILTNSQLSSPRDNARSNAISALKVAVGGYAAFRSGAAVAVIGQPQMPPITGAFDHVGVRIVQLDGCRAKVFYPAVIGSNKEGPYCTDGLETSEGMASLVGFDKVGLSFLLDHLANAGTGAEIDATPINPSTKLPLLVYSHVSVWVSPMERAYASL